MAKYQLVTLCGFVGSDEHHEIDGDFKSEAEALEAFGGDEAAWNQTLEDISPESYIEEVEE